MATERAPKLAGSKSSAGFYVAHHPLYDRADFGPGLLFKVGHTGDLGRRLCDDAYVTAWPGSFAYRFTLETESKEAAERIEARVLACCAEFRPGKRSNGDRFGVELVAGLPLDQIQEVARGVAEALGVAVVERVNPVYPRTTVSSGGSSKTVAENGTDAALCRHLVVPPALTNEELGAVIDAAVVAQREDAEGVVASAETIAPVKAKTAAIEVKRVAAPVEKKVAVTLVADDFVEGDDEVGDVELANPSDLRAGVELEDRAYQLEAIAAIIAELEASSLAIAQMACRSGKTYVAYGVFIVYLAGDGTARILYLVPGLSLLRQTAQKLVGYGVDPELLLLIGSDSEPVPLYPAGATEPVTLRMTTDPAAIAAAIAGRARVIISTYQSSPLIPPTAEFALTIFDEAHRTCGDARNRPFSCILRREQRDNERRLFLTATPEYRKLPITMKDCERFGGVAYRYYLQDGIRAGYVNDFALNFVIATEVAKKGVTEIGIETLAQQVTTAMTVASKMLVFCRNIKHARTLMAEVSAAKPNFECLIAHSRMPDGERIDALRRFSAAGTRAALFNCRLFQEGVEIPLCDAVFFAAPRNSSRDIIQSVCRPLNKVPGKSRSTIFIPVAIDVSSLEVKAPDGKAPDGKTIDVKTLPPARLETTLEQPENLKRFASIVPFVDALMEEDPRLYEHLLDPSGKEYPIDCLGARSLGLIDNIRRYQLLSAVRRAARYGNSASTKTSRLIRTDAIPWDIYFGEVKRVVETCDRYPKGTDSYKYGDFVVPFGRVHKRIGERYRETKWPGGDKAIGRAKKNTKPRPQLEPHQMRALETLKGWNPYGMDGPYHWPEAIQTLRDWLEDEANGGVPPMLEIHKGGFVGLGASRLERLAGALTCINQQDGRDRKRKDGTPGEPGSGFQVDEKKQKDLDDLCSDFNLEWRKERDENGCLIGHDTVVIDRKGKNKIEFVYTGLPTFIQEASARFMKYYNAFKAGGNDGAFIHEYFPGYPHKHQAQQDLGVAKEDTPVRLRFARKRQKQVTAVKKRAG